MIAALTITLAIAAVAFARFVVAQLRQEQAEFLYLTESTSPSPENLSRGRLTTSPAFFGGDSSFHDSEV